MRKLVPRHYQTQFLDQLNSFRYIMSLNRMAFHFGMQFSTKNSEKNAAFRKIFFEYEIDCKQKQYRIIEQFCLSVLALLLGTGLEPEQRNRKYWIFLSFEMWFLLKKLLIHQCLTIWYHCSILTPIWFFWPFSIPFDILA